jgi:hypothetical protein
VDLGGFVNAALRLAVMGYAARQLHVVPSAAQILGFCLLCAAGILIHYSLMFLLASVAFWTVRAQGIVWGYYSLFNVSRVAGRGLPRDFSGPFSPLPFRCCWWPMFRRNCCSTASPRRDRCCYCWGWAGFAFSSRNWFGGFAFGHYTSASASARDTSRRSPAKRYHRGTRGLGATGGIGAGAATEASGAGGLWPRIKERTPAPRGAAPLLGTGCLMSVAQIPA